MNAFVKPGVATRFHGFSAAPGSRSALRERITEATRLPESEAVAGLLRGTAMTPEAARAAQSQAMRLAQRMRDRKPATGQAGLVQGLMQEYALSSQEGVALMCLAEALLRIPDVATRDALIRDKVSRGDWQAHAGRSASLFVNAATWGLLVTGRLMAAPDPSSLSAPLARLIAHGGAPLIRKGVDAALRVMGEQFVMGERIDAALARARALEARGFRYSYDMLGEAATTAEDAERYRRAYEEAIHAIGRAGNGRGVHEGPGISIKLSALHPRYARAQHARVMEELYPVLRDLTLLARRHDIGLSIDAEESDRLELSLDLLERLCFEPELAGFEGIGFVVQAYQKRCPRVVEFLIDLARRSRHRLMVRLVKGAYWDSEIKRAQVDGQMDYPVYTRKAHTDLSYLVCARMLLAAPDAIYPQFATHNAHTLSAIQQLADPAAWWPGQYEFQCLHGMGETLYQQVVGHPEDGTPGRPCRIYAPVGTHETLLAYLVRRLLENGANHSFVNRIADPAVPLEALAEDPVASVRRLAREEGTVGLAHPAVPAPVSLFGPARRNSHGLDLANERTLSSLESDLTYSARHDWTAPPLLAASDAPSDEHAPVRERCDPPGPSGEGWAPVRNPADPADIVGHVRAATPSDIDAALASADDFAPVWAATSVTARATVLERAADLLQAQMPLWLGLLTREAGKTCANGVAEVREAIDFLRYYAAQARADFDPQTHRPLGPVVCISPWNFPLAIFVGQIAAALAAGNTVLAKPAEQTPLVAAQAVRLLHRAGVPRAAVQLLPGDGPGVGAPLAADPRVQGVMFTGSTDVAKRLQRQLARRLGASGAPVPLIAETGGQNAMIVESSALLEQVVADVMASAFDSAGQRCSALRVLFVQQEVADRLLRMLHGAMAEANVGDPARLDTDVGPVIDDEARRAIESHVEAMRMRGRPVDRLGRRAAADDCGGHHVMPALIEIASLAELDREIFGPVLHVIRYARHELHAVLAQIHATGYGLTLGLHTRLDETIEAVSRHARVGNVYVNRNMVGAVVGVQPFGGEGLSGTGPKAGGPLYLYRLLSQSPPDVLKRAMACGLPGAAPVGEPVSPAPAFAGLLDWIGRCKGPALVAACRRVAEQAAAMQGRVLAGPTGERNVYGLHPRGTVLCLADTEDALLLQLAGALATGCRVLIPTGMPSASLWTALPPAVRDALAAVADWTAPEVAFDVVLQQGSRDGLLRAARHLAEREGPIVALWRSEADDAPVSAPPLHALVIERVISTNTAAAGGNASLMTIG